MRGGTFALVIAALVLILILLALFLLRPSTNPVKEKDERGAEPVREEPTVEGTTAREPSKGGPSNVVVRVSGTQGTDYSGSYGTARELQLVNAATLEAEPTDYELGTIEDEEGALNATFKKTRPGKDTLVVEILVDGEVVTRSETSAELGSVTVNWVPPGALPEGTALPKELEKGRSR